MGGTKAPYAEGKAALPALVEVRDGNTVVAFRFAFCALMGGKVCTQRIISRINAILHINIMHTKDYYSESTQFGQHFQYFTGFVWNESPYN